MKKIILLVLLALVSVSVSARKSYITVSAHPYNGDDYFHIALSGDVPSDIPKIAPGVSDGDGQDDGYWITRSYSIGQMLNILSGYGYEVELMTPISEVNYSYVQYLLSKEIPSGNHTEVYGDVNKDGSVNISDISELVHIILDYVRANPSVLEESK
ncbi:MAG: hypothetical protein IJK41_05845 [Muribaculaceae bacterium]|nr:hypothetical protein [Muribaculaceae bacterium]